MRPAGRSAVWVLVYLAASARSALAADADVDEVLSYAIRLGRLWKWEQGQAIPGSRVHDDQFDKLDSTRVPGSKEGGHRHLQCV